MSVLVKSARLRPAHVRAQRKGCIRSLFKLCCFPSNYKQAAAGHATQLMMRCIPDTREPTVAIMVCIPRRFSTSVSTSERKHIPRKICRWKRCRSVACDRDLEPKLRNELWELPPYRDIWFDARPMGASFGPSGAAEPSAMPAAQQVHGAQGTLSAQMSSVSGTRAGVQPQSVSARGAWRVPFRWGIATSSTQSWHHLAATAAKGAGRRAVAEPSAGSKPTGASS